MSDEVFIGFVEDYEKYQEAKGAEASGASEDKEIRKIAYDNMDPISDDDLKLLQTTITRHDYATVYMQPMMNFYDDFYHEDPDTYETLLSEVKNIRRIYVNYQDFLRALDIRDQYIDSIIDKYGGEGLFEVYYKAGLVTDWIPPEPQLSKRSKDYERHMSGGDWWSVDGEFDYDLFRDLTEQLINDMDIHIETIGTRGDVVTSPVIIKNASYGTKVDQSYGRNSNNINGVSTSDLNALQAMFRQWYEEEKSTDDKVDTNEWFCNTPEAIRARYYTKPIVYMDQKFGGPEPEESYDPNEMIMDPELNRPMTRAEYDKRKFVRMLRDSGWSELRMMRYLGVGSKYEQKLMFMKQKNRKKAKKKAVGLIQSIMGDDTSSMNFFDSTDDLRGVLFDD